MFVITHNIAPTATRLEGNDKNGTEKTQIKVKITETNVSKDKLNGKRKKVGEGS